MQRLHGVHDLLTDATKKHTQPRLKSTQVCESVASSLVGQKLSSFTGVRAFVLRAFEESLSGILNKRTVDVLHDVQRQRAKGRPYVVVFCGVNGVGKSTNLAKIAYWLGSHGA
jgi:signal recognition particle receptor subunit alpha